MEAQTCQLERGDVGYAPSRMISKFVKKSHSFTLDLLHRLLKVYFRFKGAININRLQEVGIRKL
jgi:hypothetical protein